MCDSPVRVDLNTSGLTPRMNYEAPLAGILSQRRLINLTSKESLLINRKEINEILFRDKVLHIKLNFTFQFSSLKMVKTKICPELIWSLSVLLPPNSSAVYRVKVRFSLLL